MKKRSLAINDEKFAQVSILGTQCVCTQLVSIRFFKLTLLEIEIVKNELRPPKIGFFDFPDFFPVEFFHLMKGRLRMQSFKIMGQRLPIAFVILQ